MQPGNGVISWLTARQDRSASRFDRHELHEGIETSNFIDDETWTTWLDVRGSPLTQRGRIIERFRRPNYGSLQIEVTIEDLKADTRPFNATINKRLSADTQLIEFVCRDKSAEHYVGASGIPDRVLKEQEAQKAAPPAGR